MIYANSPQTARFLLTASAFRNNTCLERGGSWLITKIGRAEITFCCAIKSISSTLGNVFYHSALQDIEEIIDFSVADCGNLSSSSYVLYSNTGQKRASYRRINLSNTQSGGVGIRLNTLSEALVELSTITFNKAIRIISASSTPTEVSSVNFVQNTKNADYSMIDSDEINRIKINRCVFITNSFSVLTKNGDVSGCTFYGNGFKTSEPIRKPTTLKIGHTGDCGCLTNPVDCSCGFTMKFFKRIGRKN